MNRHQHHTDLYVRRLPLATDEQAALMSDEQTRQQLFEEITTQPVDTDDRASAGLVRLSRRTFVLVAVLTSLGLATVGWAVSTFITPTTSSVACHLPDGAVSVVAPVTGDATVDCAAHWVRETGEQPPELVAYDNGAGGIEVVPASTEPSEGWIALEPGVTQDPAVVELEAALEDHVTGLPSKCHLADEARQLVDGELDRLGLAGWSVVVERGQADGTDTCTYFVMDAQQQTVALIPIDGLVAPDDSVARRFAGQLDRAFTEDCMTLNEAAGRVLEIAAEQDIDPAGLMIHEVDDDTAGCASIDLRVGGRFEVTIRGSAT